MNDVSVDKTTLQNFSVPYSVDTPIKEYAFEHRFRVIFSPENVSLTDCVETVSQRWHCGKYYLNIVFREPLDNSVRDALEKAKDKIFESISVQAIRGDGEINQSHLYHEVEMVTSVKKNDYTTSNPTKYVVDFITKDCSIEQ